MNNTSRRHLLTRRDLLKLAGALPIAAINAPWLAPIGAAGGRHIAGYDPHARADAGHARALAQAAPRLRPDSRHRYAAGARVRGMARDPGHRARLHARARSYRLTSWECDVEKDCSIDGVEDGGAKRRSKSSRITRLPRQRGTGPVTGRVLYAGTDIGGRKALVEKTDAATLADAIVVVDMPLGGGGAGRRATAAANARRCRRFRVRCRRRAVAGIPPARADAR